ncbi:hypothetical protein P7C71_g1051, partial [Lecanoromycetidae sp. Uapishka_2]
MPLVIEMAQEGDIQRLLDIVYAAFEHDSWHQIMIPQIPGPEQRTASIARWRDEILVDPDTTVLKVVDTDLNEIIALARWHIYRFQRPESEWKGAPASICSQRIQTTNVEEQAKCFSNGGPISQTSQGFSHATWRLRL